MLVENSAEICEAYNYEFINNLTREKEILTQSEGINMINTLSYHLM